MSRKCFPIEHFQSLLLPFWGFHIDMFDRSRSEDCAVSIEQFEEVEVIN